MCEGKTREEVLEATYQRIQRHGFTMAGIEPSDDHPSWFYTMGLVDRHNHPELAILGLEQEVGFPVLGTLAQSVIRGQRFRANDHVHVEGMCLHLAEVDQRIWEGDMFNQWRLYYYWERGELPPTLALELRPGASSEHEWYDVETDLPADTELLPLIRTP